MKNFGCFYIKHNFSRLQRVMRVIYSDTRIDRKQTCETYGQKIVAPIDM